MPDRATLEELMTFANAVREAGGGNPIDALMPAVPQDSSRCLIARNLNFNCRVTGPESDSSFASDCWVMTVEDSDVRDRIAIALGLEREDDEYGRFYSVLLPAAIGQVAADFDQAADDLADTVSDAEYDFQAKFGWWPGEGEADADKLTPFLAARVIEADAEVRERLGTMLPYIAEASAEARSIASLINPDGSIVL